jgi:catechol 2,3-dioxygenase-like lactoylglutathione lyase family enzyme
MPQPILPELYVSDFGKSLLFYVNVIGFCVRYDRPEERFAYLELNGLEGSAELMIEQTVTPERTFVAGALEYPFGRGMNLSITVPNVDAVHKRVLTNGNTIFLPLEERWYRQDTQEVGNRQFVVMDPDGYLLRIIGDLGTRAFIISSE